MGRQPLKEGDAQQKMAAEQAKVHAAVEKKNPFSPANLRARREEALRKLRQDRGLAEPRQAQQGGSDDPRGEASGAGDVDSGSTEPASERSERVARDVLKEEKKPESADAVPDWYKRQQELTAAESRAREASANVERQRAEIEKVKADADAAVQRMAAAKDDPVQFLAEAGMTQEEWSSFIGNGGKMTPEQKKLKEMSQTMAKMQERVEAAEKRAQQQEQQARIAYEESQFASELQKLTYIPEMGGIAAIRERQRILSLQTKQPVSLKDAAEHLEEEMGKGLQRLLQNKKIRSNLGLDVNTSHAGQAAETPRTLSNRVSSDSGQKEVAPHPLDWAAKRRLYQQRVERERQAMLSR